MFALISTNVLPMRMNLKFDPEEAVELREKYESVIPGYHMNKKHWNSILLDGSVPDKIVLKWINDSYELVNSSIKRKTGKG